MKCNCFHQKKKKKVTEFSSTECRPKPRSRTKELEGGPDHQTGKLTWQSPARTPNFLLVVAIMALHMSAVDKTDFILRTKVHSVLLESSSEDAKVQLPHIHFSTCGSHNPFSA